MEQKCRKATPYGPLGVIALQGCTQMGKNVDEHLVKWRHEDSEQRELGNVFEGYIRDSYLIENSLPRFGSGEGKGMIRSSVRGMDLYLMVDVCNYSTTYTISGKLNPMSPDDHFQNLKRIIAAVAGKARRITVIMPFLYESRQHKKNGRESLDCALALQELADMGVDQILTFDAHDDRVQNAIPLTTFESVPPAYQFIKGLLKAEPDLTIDSSHMMVISPDDMISSGETVIDIARELKHRKAGRIFILASFGLFTGGLEPFDKAYGEGLFDRIVTTDLIYQPPELLSRPYYTTAGMGKYIALLIDTLNHDASIEDYIDPVGRIHRFVDAYNSEKQG